MENFSIYSPLDRPRCGQSTTDSVPSSRAHLMDNFSRWWHGELLNLLTIQSAKMRPKYDRLGTIFKGKLDGQPQSLVAWRIFRSPHHLVDHGASKVLPTRHHLQGHACLTTLAIGAMENSPISSPLGRPRCEQSTTDSAPSPRHT